MTVCVPIKELKNTTAFAATVRESEGPVIVTRNGQEAFAVLRMDDLAALRREAARAELYRLVDEAEQDFASGRVADAAASQVSARERYGL